jgi:hypothetical protein
MNQSREIASIIKDHVQGFAILECGQSLFNTPEVFLLSFAFPGKDRDASGSDATIKALYKRFSTMRDKNIRSSGMILSRKDVL